MMKKILASFCFAINFAKANQHHTHCEISLDCVENWENCEEGFCLHKSIYPLNSVEIVGCFMIILFLMYSNTGGLGGGGIIIPLVMIFFGFNMKETIANTISTGFTSALVRYFMNINQFHPTKVD
jgi:hypothetical protein